MFKRLTFISALAACLHIGTAAAQSLEYPEREGRFLERGSEGWFWYEPIPEESEEPDPVEEPPSPPEPIETVKIPEPPAPAEPPKSMPAPPAKLSAEWIRKNMQKYRDAAWDNPTPENVAAFLYLQSYTIDKSRKMADAATEVIAVNPILDVSTSRPSTQGAYEALDIQAARNKERLISKLSEQIGIWFFYDQGVLSERQAGVLNLVQTEFGISILPVSLDGTPMPEGRFEKWVMDQGHSTQLNILSVPALLVVHPDGKFASLGQGGLSKPEIESRLLIIARQHGWISEEEFNSTKGDLTPVGQIARTIESRIESTNPDENHSDPDGFIPPQELIKDLNSNVLMTPNGGRN